MSKCWYVCLGCDSAICESSIKHDEYMECECGEHMPKLSEIKSRLAKFECHNYQNMVAQNSTSTNKESTPCCDTKKCQFWDCGLCGINTTVCSLKS